MRNNRDPGRLRRRVSEATHWLRRLMEADPLAEMSRMQRLLARNIRVVFLVARREVYGSIKLNAQALTYDTLLALVPLLVVLFAVLKGFGATENISARVIEAIVQNLAAAPEMQATVREYLERFIGNAQSGGGAVPIALLLALSAISLLGHIESSLNTIFGAERERSLVTRLLTYWAVLTFGPVLLLASFGLTAAFQTGPMGAYIDSLGEVGGFLLSAVPLLVTWVGFATMYLVVPNTRVRPGAAILAAIVAGSLWNGWKYGYAIYAKYAMTLQSVYGKLAVIPLFIFWLYLSWVLVLFGAHLAFAFQNSSTYRREDERAEASFSFSERAVLRLFLEVARDFHAARPPSDLHELAVKLGVPRRLLDGLVQRLRAGGFVRFTEPERGLVPGLDIAQVTVHSLLSFLRTGADTDPALVDDAARRFFDDLLGRLDDERARLSGSLDFRELAQRFETASARSVADSGERPADVH
ncbi:MAG: YihY family inner membrane protein [Deltaproteobacteria bacterium]|nr:YihY family inner membrane protein [Deltaproteobacteria bacterium]